MGPQQSSEPHAGVSRPPPRLRRLLPPGEPATAAEIVTGFGLWERPPEPAGGRPRVLLNMVSSLDGRAALGGRSAPLSGPADRQLFHALRLPVDAILVGAGTARAERYGRLIADEHGRRLRGERGLPPEPLACIATRSLALDRQLPLLAHEQSRVVVLTASPGTLGECAADVRYVRAERAGELDLAAALAMLTGELGVATLLCEGGPHLANDLLVAGLLDEVFLSLAPTLAGGDPTGAGPGRILAGAELDPPVELELLSVLESDGQLFLRYSVVAPDRVSRETMLSSSPAR